MGSRIIGGRATMVDDDPFDVWIRCRFENRRCGRVWICTRFDWTRNCMADGTVCRMAPTVPDDDVQEKEQKKGTVMPDWRAS